MTIKEVTFERLYSDANIKRVSRFENERLGATATVENGDVAAAWNEVRAEVEAENARREAARQRLQTADGGDLAF